MRLIFGLARARSATVSRDWISVATDWASWSVIRQTYHQVATLVPGVDAPRVVTGAPTVPLWVFEPNTPGP